MASATPCCTMVLLRPHMQERSYGYNMPLHGTWYMIEKVKLFTRSEVIHILSKNYPLPKPYTTDVLTKAQIEFIAQQLPSPKATTGRPAYSNQELLPGILRVLRSGCRWGSSTLNRGHEHQRSSR